MTRFDLVVPSPSRPIGPGELVQRRPPRGLHDLRASAPFYQVDAALADAVNVALTLGTPLLLTGEPGTGKTQVAYSYERCMAGEKCSEAGTEFGVEGDHSKGDYCNRNQEGRGSHPINCVDWEQAKAFCAWVGKRLPTQWEWEWAARGRDEARTYPWGEEEPTCERAVMSQGGDGCGKDRTWHVGSKPRGNSRDGVKDMAGNVWEWTSSKSGEERVVRGGSWNCFNPEGFRASFRLSNLPSYRSASWDFVAPGPPVVPNNPP